MQPSISGASGARPIDPDNRCSPPSTFDRPADNVSGSAVRNREPTIRDYFQKAERFFPEELE
jgi:hypothetical protein